MHQEQEDRRWRGNPVARGRGSFRARGSGLLRGNHRGNYGGHMYLAELSDSSYQYVNASQHIDTSHVSLCKIHSFKYPLSLVSINFFYLVQYHQKYCNRLYLKL